PRRDLWPCCRVVSGCVERTFHQARLKDMATSAHLRPPRVSGTRTPVRVLAVALVGLLAAGCSTQDYASTQESFDSTASTEQERSGDEGTGDQDVGTESAEGESDEGPDGEDLGANVQIEDRHLVHTADMTVRVEDVDEATEQAKELTAASDGHVSAEQIRTPTGGSSVSTLRRDRKSTRLNSSHVSISYAVFC